MRLLLRFLTRPMKRPTVCQNSVGKWRDLNKQRWFSMNIWISITRRNRISFCLVWGRSLKAKFHSNSWKSQFQMTTQYTRSFPKTCMEASSLRFSRGSWKETSSMIMSPLSKLFSWRYMLSKIQGGLRNWTTKCLSAMRESINLTFSILKRTEEKKKSKVSKSTLHTKLN